MSTMDWGRAYRTMTATETTIGVGAFDPNVTPYMEYVFDCLDNTGIPVISAMKPARIAWTEVINTHRGKRIHTEPTTMLLGFATGTAARTFAKGKFKDFLLGVPILKEIIDVGIASNKKSIFDYSFPNGSLRLKTLGSITSVKSDNIPYVEIEEPDDAPVNIAGQGDLLDILIQRQKLVPKTRRKLIFGGTPTDKDFSLVESASKKSNQLVFKAECHHCGHLVPMDGQTMLSQLKYAEYPNRYIDDIYGKFDPYSAWFECPACMVEWSFEQKNLNVIAGKKHGFTDHTGNFSKGWHPIKPNITDHFGFRFSELLSPFKDGSDFVELAKSHILSNIELAKGNEGLMKSYYNNRLGLPYASGFSAIEAEEMKTLRSNYPEHIVPMEGLVLTCGVDVQHNRFAIVVRAWGRNNNSWLVTWKEIFGNVMNYQDKVWEELKQTLLMDYPHASGKTLQISAGSIDSGDGSTSELVYRFINEISEHHNHIFATKGVKELRYSQDEIYREPASMDAVSYKPIRRSLAETMGVKVYIMGAHKAHDEILRRIGLNKSPDCVHDRYYFNEQTYGQYEEQITSCRKLIDVTGSTQKEVYKLISGKRKEALDCEKNSLHSAYAIGIMRYTSEHWKAIETYLYRDLA